MVAAERTAWDFFSFHPWARPYIPSIGGRKENGLFVPSAQSVLMRGGGDGSLPLRYCCDTNLTSGYSRWQWSKKKDKTQAACMTDQLQYNFSTTPVKFVWFLLDSLKFMASFSADHSHD